MDRYEQDREDNAVGPDDDGRYDLGEIGPDQLEKGLPLGDYPIEHYGDSVEDDAYTFGDNDGLAKVRKAANAQFMFFMDAMKRNGVL